MFGLMAKQGFLSDAVFVAATDIVFKSPAFPGDRLSAEVNILDKKEGKRGGGPITYRWSVKNQEGKLIAEGVNT
jgi:acyl dehydratase